MPSRRLISTSDTRVQALKTRHAILSSRIEDAQKSPSINDFYLRQLKKQKLLLKEEIVGIREDSHERASA